LFVIQGPQLGSVFALHEPSILVGRGSSADVLLSDDSVSSEQARLLLEAGQVYLEDLGSERGTFLNDERVTQRMKLVDGDRLRFGGTTLARFSMVDELEERALLTLFELSLRDPLTRLYNRRYFDRRVHDEFSFAQRHGAALAVLLIDIDHFKRVNDTFGHHVGDVVLEVVAHCIQKMMRPEDVLARYGGEEFIVLARSTSLRNAEILAERVRRSVQALALNLNGNALRVTVSVGVAALDAGTHFHAEDELVAAADSAMYSAKRAGRNSVSVTPRRPHDGPGGVASGSEEEAPSRPDPR
jgi:diguanylate cyclase (GGDEF)-like protein